MTPLAAADAGGDGRRVPAAGADTPGLPQHPPRRRPVQQHQRAVLGEGDVVAECVGTLHSPWPMGAMRELSSQVPCCNVSSRMVRGRDTASQSPLVVPPHTPCLPFLATPLSFPVPQEYWLPGAFAWGYIACTGTNFVIRARALACCGWFPNHTVTEGGSLCLPGSQEWSAWQLFKAAVHVRCCALRW